MTLPLTSRPRKATLAAHAIALCIPVLAGPVAHAQQPLAPPSDRWQLEVTPYLWAAGMQGDVGIGRLAAEGASASLRAAGWCAAATGPTDSSAHASSIR